MIHIFTNEPTHVLLFFLITILSDYLISINQKILGPTKNLLQTITHTQDNMYAKQKKKISVAQKKF